MKDYMKSGVKPGVNRMKSNSTANVSCGCPCCWENFCGEIISKVTGEISTFGKLYHVHCYLPKSSSS